MRVLLAVALATGTALAFAPIGVTLVFALMVGLSESRLGTRRTAAAFPLGQVAGALGAAGVLLLATPATALERQPARVAAADRSATRTTSVTRRTWGSAALWSRWR